MVPVIAPPQPPAPTPPRWPPASAWATCAGATAGQQDDQPQRISTPVETAAAKLRWVEIQQRSDQSRLQHFVPRHRGGEPAGNTDEQEGRYAEEGVVPDDVAEHHNRQRRRQDRTNRLQQDGVDLHRHGQLRLGRNARAVTPPIAPRAIKTSTVNSPSPYELQRECAIPGCPSRCS
jgi:hypothetical protein